MGPGHNVVPNVNMKTDVQGPADIINAQCVVNAVARTFTRRQIQLMWFSMM